MFVRGHFGKIPHSKCTLPKEITEAIDCVVGSEGLAPPASCL
jgi:hypothetical protein